MAHTPTATNTPGHGYKASGELWKAVHQAKADYLAALRAIPPERVAPFTFRTPDDAPVTLAELFGDHTDLLVIHNMGRRCNHCTLWADGLSGYTTHITRRCALALCSADEPPTLRAAIAERGWTFPCVSGLRSGFNAAMGFGSDERALPGVSSFHRNPDGTIDRVCAAPFGPGDDFCPVFPLFDLLHDGPADWQPR